MLTIQDVTLHLAGKTLLEGASLAIDRGARVGLVGQNGVGKSTLLKAIAGELAVDKGEITIPTRWSLAMTRQEAPGGDQSLIDTVMGAHEEMAALLAKAEAGEGDLAEIYERLDALDAYTARARAATILAGLGFDEAVQARPCHEFSGGWRMRVALASLLFLSPDLLLLDEPTNHLDLEAVVWLETYLVNYPGTIILVSHDRGLLNRCVTQITHLSEARLRLYAGDYDTFEKQRALQMEIGAKAKAKQDSKRAHLSAFVERFRAKASKAKQAQSRLKMLEKMSEIAVINAERTLPLSFPNPDPLPSPLLTLERVSVGYDGPPILKHIHFQLGHEDRIALLGANGQGKSTLLKLLVGHLKAHEGEVRRSAKLRVGYFAQHQSEALRLSETPMEALTHVMPDGSTQTQIRSRLGGFGFSEDKATTRIANLSGGQKARLLLALMSFDRPHILLLDESTNHLDMDSRHALIEAIQNFKGAVILVSHDPDLVAACADSLWLVNGGTVQPYPGDLDDYRAFLLGKVEKKPDPPKPKPPQPNKQASKDLRAIARAAERDIDRLTAMIAKTEEKMADPTLYTQSSQKAAGYGALLADLKKQLTTAEGIWLRAEAALE